MAKELNEYVNIVAGGSSVDGNPSFRGGPYGAGHKKQLATVLNPATQAMEDQEQAELNQNVEDQAKINRNFKKGSKPPYPMQDIHSDEELKRDVVAKKYDPMLDERNDADAFYTHLPGNIGMNALEDPKRYVPDENLVVNKLRAGVSDGTEEYLIDDIVAELEDDQDSKSWLKNLIGVELKEFGIGSGGGGANYQNALPSAIDGEDLDFRDNQEKEELGHQGLEAAKTYASGMGGVLFPKKFVPSEWPQESSLIDKDMDGIADNIDKNERPELDQEINKMDEAKRQKHKSERHKERYGEKTPSMPQVSKKFKEARRVLLDLWDVLEKTGGGFLGQELDHMVGVLRRMEGQMPADYGSTPYMEESNSLDQFNEGTKILIKNNINRTESGLYMLKELLRHLEPINKNTDQNFPKVKLQHAMQSFDNFKSSINEYYNDSDFLDEEALDEKFASKAQQRYFYAQAGKGGKKGKKWKKMADEFSKDTDYDKLPERSPKNESKSLSAKDIAIMIKEEIRKQLLNDK